MTLDYKSEGPVFEIQTDGVNFVPTELIIMQSTGSTTSLDLRGTPL